MASMQPGLADVTGSGGAAVSLFGDRIHGRKQERDKESPSAETQELHAVSGVIDGSSDRKRYAELEKAQAKPELFSTRKTVKELLAQIVESDAKAMVHKDEIQVLKKCEEVKGWHLMAGGEGSEGKYRDLMQELVTMKKELSKLKVKMANAFREKVDAEKASETSELRTASFMNMIEELTKEIVKVNKDHALVEIASLEAVREAGEVEAQRKAEAEAFAKNIKQAKAEIEEMSKEVSQMESLKQKLAATNADISVLQNEKELLRAMVKNSNNTTLAGEEEKRIKQEVENDEASRMAKAELEASKKELASVKEKGFQLMASMDAVREELKQISSETARLKKLEVKQDLTIQCINSKLLRAKFKLETVTASEEKSRAIVSNLSAALQQLQSETESAKKEKEMTGMETEIVQMDMENTNNEICLLEKRLEAAMLELERVKASEAAALDELKLLSERSRKNRASSAKVSPSIRISRFEYEYLLGHAEGARKVADKKVGAALAWVEALKTSEKEMMMKIEITQREIRDLEIAESEQLNKMQKSLTLVKELELELFNFTPQEEATAANQVVTVPRKSFKENGVPVASRKSKTRRRSSLSHGTRQFPRSPSITLRRRRKMIPSLVKFLRGKG